MGEPVCECNNVSSADIEEDGAIDLVSKGAETIEVLQRPFLEADGAQLLVHVEQHGWHKGFLPNGAYALRPKLKAEPIPAKVNRAACSRGGKDLGVVNLGFPRALLTHHQVM